MASPKMLRIFLKTCSRRPSSHNTKPHLDPLERVRGCASVAGCGVPYETLQDPNQTAATEVPSQAEVVVIGGGIAGCSTLYHLTKLGLTNVVLLEKDNLTAGTTWHTAGMLWRLRPSDTDVQLLGHSRNLYKSLEEETSVHAGWIENGGLFIASTKERLDEYKRLQTLGRHFGVESFVLGSEETKKLYPLMNVDDVYGTLYSPGDGSIDPAGACTALTRGARMLGAKIIEKCSVTGIGTEKDDFGVNRVKFVETSAGRIKTDCVVNATGVWAPYIGAMAGVEVPLVAMHHSYIVTERIEGIQNMPNTRDHDASVYLKLQGDGLSIGGYENNPIFWEKVQKDFAFGLFELDWDVFSVHIEGAINRIPVVETTGIKSTVCGPESFTPDHKPLLGEAHEARGFYHCCGFNSGGMMFGGGCGWQLAEWIVHGRPSLDMYGYDIRRYYPRLAGNASWVNERSHESYAKNYAMVFPHDQALAARNQRLDPLHPLLEAAGCVFEEKLGWERPGWFNPNGVAQLRPYDFYGAYGNDVHEDYLYRELLKKDYTYEFPENHELIADECRGCREAAALFDMSYFGQYFLTGPDAVQAANWIFSADVDKPPGSVVYTCMLNSRGGVEGDLTVTVVAPGKGRPHDPMFDGDRGFYVAVGGGAAQQGLEHMKKVIEDKRFNVSIVDSTDSMGLLSLQGPNSRGILQRLTDEDLSDDAFPFSTSKMINVGGHEVRALRLTFVGELGWELHLPFESMVDVYQKIMSAGADFGLVNAGYRAIDSLSVEKGYRHWHADVRPDDTPQEAGLLFTCKLKTEKPFLGREAVERQKETGVNKRLACFTIDDHVHVLGNEAIWRDGQVVGYLRRAEYAHYLDRSVGYGYVRRPDGELVTPAWLKEGEYCVEIKGKQFPATFHSKSPFDPNNLRIKGAYDELVRDQASFDGAASSRMRS